MKNRLKRTFSIKFLLLSVLSLSSSLWSQTTHTPHPEEPYAPPILAATLSEQVFEEDQNSENAIWPLNNSYSANESNVQVIIPVDPELNTTNTSKDEIEYFDFPQGMIVASPLQDEIEETKVEEDQRGYVINFDNVGIIEYLRWISNITHKNFIFDEQELNFNITIISKEPASIDVIMASLLQILRINNLNLMEQGNNIIIYQSKGGDTSPSTTVIAGEDTTPREANALVTKVFKIKNAQTARIQSIVTPLLSQKALVEISPETRHLIVTDLAINVQKIEELLITLDKPDVGLDIGMYHVQNINIQTLISLTQRIVTPLAEENPLILVPQPSTDTIFIISTPFLIEKTASVMSTLDVDSGILTEEQRMDSLPEDHIDRTVFKVHKLRYHQGNEIQTSLRKIGNTLSHTGIANAGLVATIKTIEWLESTNSLVFSGDSESIAKLIELVNTLDIPKREVFIEMLVIETSVLKSLSIGVTGAGNVKGPHADVIAGYGGSGLTNAIATAAAGGDPNGNLITKLGKGFTAGAIGKGISLGNDYYLNLAGLLDALQGDSETSIIMNPQIVTESAHAAELFVGNTDRFQSSTIQGTQGTTTVTNYEYRQIGSRLVVTPTIGNSNIITLDIDQSIQTNLGVNNTDSVADGVPVPITSDKSTRTRVHVPDKYFLILSGMIYEKKQNTQNKVPCLGSAPIVGSMLGGVSNSYDKRNIMIFIRPQIITTPEEVDEVSKKQKKFLQEEWKSEDANFQINGLLDWLQLKDR